MPDVLFRRVHDVFKVKIHILGWAVGWHFLSKVREQLEVVRIQNHGINWERKDLNTPEIIDPSLRPMWLNLAFFLFYLGQTTLLIPPHLSDTLSQLQILIPIISEFHWYEDIPSKRHLFENRLSVNCRTSSSLYSCYSNSDNRHPLCDCSTILNPAGAWRKSYKNTETCNNTHIWRPELCAIANSINFTEKGR